MSEKILLVDDNAAFIDSIKDILEDEGYQVAVAHTGEAAIEMTRKDRFALVLMDIRMPGMNGVECFLEMKARNSDVRVILFTAYALQDLIRVAEENGVWAVLKKPLNMDALIETVARAKIQDGGACILVADDDRVLCDNLLEVLSQEGYRVGVACDGREAVRMVQKASYDLLLLDLKMPKLNGLEVYRKVKTLCPNLITVLMTGYTEEYRGLVGQTMSDSACPLLSKPIDMDRLLNLVSRITQDRQNGILQKPAREGP